MFIVIDTFSEPTIVTDEDGMVKQFETYGDAMIEANDCQEALVVPLEGIQEFIDLLQEASSTIDVMRFECGEDSDEDDLEGRINACLSKYDPGSVSTEENRLKLMGQ